MKFYSDNGIDYVCDLYLCNLLKNNNLVTDVMVANWAHRT